MMSCHLSCIRSEAHYEVGEVCVHPDGGADVGLGQGGLHLGHEEGELLRDHNTTDNVLPYGTAVNLYII